ncbi:MAG: hypothetical protein COW27_04615 [Nitrosopumilales archaeon CG15_BIG_FIL_POST_REV_8_21_14_020_37_12]|nr:MAG: hypothetical protein COW27_04615 [Nitrosopumilales archaeon CG15_BIG_FIL_POST_REV_8_21_14_020_37_12]
MNDLDLLAEKRNQAREDLYKIMNENEHEWKNALRLLRTHEKQFVELWEAYKMDPNYVQDRFFKCCDRLQLYIYQENVENKKFKKIYKPHYNIFQKLNKKYHKLKIKSETKDMPEPR